MSMSDAWIDCAVKWVVAGTYRVASGVLAPMSPEMSIEPSPPSRVRSCAPLTGPVRLIVPERPSRLKEVAPVSEMDPAKERALPDAPMALPSEMGPAPLCWNYPPIERRAPDSRVRRPALSMDRGPLPLVATVSAKVKAAPTRLMPSGSVVAS